MPDPTTAELPLPPVERVRPGLWSIPVPIPNNPLRYVLVYAFETERGVYLVDAGWNTDDAYQTLLAGLQEAGFAIGDVKGVMVTHIHADHYGLAGRIREAAGAWVGLHPADARLIDARYDHPEQLLARMGDLLRRDGAPPEEVKILQQASMPIRALVSSVAPDVPHRGRRQAGVARVGPDGHLDPRTLARPPVLLPARPPPDAVGRPCPPPDHAQHLVPPPGRPQSPGRLPDIPGESRGL